MTSTTTPSSLALVPSLETAWQDVDSSFERFCLTAGTLSECYARTPSSSPACRIAAMEAASGTAGARPRARSASMAAMLRFIERGLDPKICRLFIIDGAKALAKASQPVVAVRRQV